MRRPATPCTRTWKARRWLPPWRVAGGTALRLHSAAADRTTYLQRPDLGRKLDESSRRLLAEAATPGIRDLAVIVADGLSALAVERHAAPLLAELLVHVKMRDHEDRDSHDRNPKNRDLPGWNLAPLCVVEQGRVAIGDEIGEGLGAQIALVLIGERPGLSSPDSLGAYVTWSPRPGRSDAERNCISNIRPEGLSYARAAEQLAYILTEARRRKLTGVGLKEQGAQIEERNP